MSHSRHPHLSRAFAPLALAALGACGSSAPPSDDLGYAGTGIGVSIAPLDLPGVNDACYSFDIRNGADQRVVARGRALSNLPLAGQGGDGGPAGHDADSGAIGAPLCSARFGNGQGALSYVAPCDASSGEVDGTPIAQHTVTLWVNAVCATGTLAGGDCTPIAGLVNPCGEDGCEVTALCVENADVPVAFNFTMMASAQQGFFDIAVNFGNVFCSAKLDTCYDDDTPITLLHDGTGERQPTAVAAVACTAGPGAEVDTHLHMTDFVVNCGAGDQILSFGSVTQEGNIAIGNLTGAVYYGTEALPTGTGGAGSANKVYTNVAFILPTTGTCSVRWAVVPSDSAEGPQPVDGAGGDFTQVSGVAFDVTGLAAGSANCAQHPLNDLSSGVTTTYFTSPVCYGAMLGLEMTEFVEVDEDPVACVPTCGVGGELLNGYAFDPTAPAALSFACVPSGKYVRGAPLGEVGRQALEVQHWVELTRSFWMQTTDVTQGQWKALSGNVNPSVYSACGDACPVENVTWYSALGFANALSNAEVPGSACYTLTGCTVNTSWQEGNLVCTDATFDYETCAGYRLPTEAEWEYAARAGTTTATYRGNLSGAGESPNFCVTLSGIAAFEGNPLTDIAHYLCSNLTGTIEAAMKAPNNWGLYDMLGNVWNWPWDWRTDYPTLANGQPITESNPLVDPLGPLTGTIKVNRGGGWLGQARRARAADRGSLGPGSRNDRLGFRLSKTFF